jgi:hypothetical protein
MSDTTTRHYDKSSMDDLVDRSRYYLDRHEIDMVEIDYLIDALELYRKQYAKLYEEIKALCA